MDIKELWNYLGGKSPYNKLFNLYNYQYTLFEDY